MYNIFYEDTVTSTNDVIKSLAKQGEKEGYVLVAEHQTSGRGRMKKSFHSPRSSGIYMSILLRPELSAESLILLTPMTAVAVTRAIKKVLDIDTEIKWVNDVFLNNKKVCGILTESALSADSRIDFAVVGIGINLNKPENDFPEEIKNTAGYLCDNAGKTVKSDLIKCVLDEFFELYSDIEDKKFYNEYKQKSFILGKEVEFDFKGERCVGVAKDIDENFSLIIKTPDKERSLSSGEVSVKLKK